MKPNAGFAQWSHGRVNVEKTKKSRKKQKDAVNSETDIFISSRLFLETLRALFTRILKKIAVLQNWDSSLR